MTDPITPRPQPVVIAGKIAGNVVGIVGGLAGLLAILGTVTHWPWALGGAAALASVAAGLGKFMPRITAAGAAAQVTPLEDPRTYDMRKLIDPDTYGKHAAPSVPVTVTAASPVRTDTQEIPQVTAASPDVDALMTRILARKGSPKEDVAAAKQWQAAQQ